MPFKVQDLGVRTNIDVIQSFISQRDSTVLDIGCGNLGFTQQLAEYFEQVRAIDPDPVQARANREAGYAANIRFEETDARSIPEKDQSIDGVFFAYSLHHIDATSYKAVFEEVFRVLKRGGFIYAIEPIDCPLNQVMKIFYDEDAERDAAQSWLASIADRFQSVEAVEYHGHVQYESFDDFATQFSSKSFNSIYSESDVRQPAVEAAFYQHAGADSDLRFQAPKRVVFLNQFLG